MGRRRKSFYRKIPKSAPNCQARPEKDSSKDAVESTPAKEGNLYPNCDTTIWLRSCKKEVTDPVEGKVCGEVPSWLHGSLLRNGPGSLQVGEMEFEHLFDSSALLHKFTVNDGKITYQNRFLQSETYKKNLAAKRIVVTEFGTKAVPDPCQTIFQRVSAVFNPSDYQSDNAMISIYPFGDKLFAMTETPFMHEIEVNTLNTGQRINLTKKLGIINHTSHPHVSPDGKVYNLGQAIYNTGPRYCILEFPEKQDDGSSVFDKARIVATVPCRWRFHPSYMHTFGITENYFIIVEQPLSVSVTKIVKNALLDLPIATALQWYEKAETIIYIVSRKSGKVTHSFATDSFFYLHIINQYEDKDHIIIDICCYKDPSMLNCMYISALKEAQNNPDYAKMFRGRPLRFVLPLKPMDELKQIASKSETKNINQITNSTSVATILSNGQIFVTPELLCTMGCETPRINYDIYCGKKYRYFYAISSDVDASNPGMLIKADLKNHTKQTWGEKNLYPSEPIFVQKPDAVEEDDGVILSSVVWGRDRINEVGLIILDARTWVEVARSTFKVDGPVPKCLHGWFVDQKT